ncbi:hypothetical protein, partial [Klebsiella pneumoniae]
GLATNIFTELKVANLLPKGTVKAFYCTEGFTQQDPEFENGNRIIELASRVNYQSEFTASLVEAMTQGKLALEQSQAITQSLERHKVLEDEVKELKSAIKAIEDKRDELVESARAKISKDEARAVIVERLRRV